MSVSAVSSIQPVCLPGSLVPQLPSENAAASESSGPSHLHMFAADDDSPSFGDLLDVINPLQHIPVINDIYREMTGDKIGVGARLVGGALYGGPIGLIGSAINAVVEEATGHDIGGTVIALFKDDPSPPSDTALASAAKPDPAASASTAADDGGGKAAAKPLLLPDPGDAAPVALTPAAAAPAAPVRTASADAAAVPPPPAAAPQASVSAEESRPMPVWGSREQRMMPVPPRTTPMATRSPPALGVSLSNSSTRSNTPIVGAPITRAPPVSPAVVQDMAASQSAALTAAQTTNPSAAEVSAAATNEWFSTAMMEGLAKYQRAAKANEAASASVSESQ